MKRLRGGPEKTKDLLLETLDKRDGDTDVKAGEENHSVTELEGRQREEREGRKDRTRAAADGRWRTQTGEEAESGEGCGQQHLQGDGSHLITSHFSLPTIELRGKRIETAQAGKSI